MITIVDVSVTRSRINELPDSLAESVAPSAEPPPPVPIAAMGDIAAGLGRIERRVPLLADDADSPRSMRLIATPDYDVWLITWPPGSGIGFHDHARATSVIRLVEGSLVETLRHGNRELGPGISVVTSPHEPHALYNRSASESTSLHVYSPPLAAVTYLDPGAGMFLHPANGNARRGATAIRPRPAEATSG